MRLFRNSEDLNEFPQIPKGIKEFSVFNNNIEQVPDELWNEKELETLNISMNRIKVLSSRIGDLVNLVNLMVTSAENEICRENAHQKHKKISDLLMDVKLDCIVKKLAETEKGFNTEDSLIIMTKWVTKVFRQPEYLIYDFSKSGRILEDIDQPNAAFYKKGLKANGMLLNKGSIEGT
ncbi:MAG: hypothetical protein ACRBF0_13450 [Calditrichia bacterium]